MTVEEARQRVKALQERIGPWYGVTLHLNASQFHFGIFPVPANSSGNVKTSWQWRHTTSIEDAFAWAEQRVSEIVHERTAPDREYESWFRGNAA